MLSSFHRNESRVRGVSSSLNLALILGFSSVFILIAGGAGAGTIFPGQYQLLDHPDGNISPPPYGLRVDALGLTFSTELSGANVILDWNGGSTATITGTLYSSAGDLWTVDYLLSGVVAAAANLGFTATAGSGTLTDPLLNVSVMTGTADGSGSVFNFFADGHRLGGHPTFGDADTPVGRGWLLPPGSTDDWLVIGVPVPEPGTALLLSLGLGALATRRTRG